ncbi:DUF3813 family protein [Virgibacillus sp. NKC19-3]|uniref:DUF3813 family protein n=1 Tax=Virgibacillus saliphilus TaxID=2831674 RepID=UPI001C9AEC5F|nr:DUF3813 family protein [Virgibacillus sp. NKC19-3]MBY7143085.1 DUF3813 family protein [Virgibacillus sp. NKC19-3]
MENNLFQQAKNAVTNFMNDQSGNNTTEQDKQAAQNAIQNAKSNASPEEQQQLQQLEQQLKQHNQLS